jgi:prepilin-type N-terminal cleavage/methylation domain-containing protein
MNLNSAHDQMKKGFTLFEIIMVIVILGIVAMIGTNIIAHMYEGYMRSKYINTLEQKTELALEIIVNRLKYRVKSTAIVRKKGTNTKDWLNSEDLNASYDMLEWIGFDYESLQGESNGTVSIPGWSGLIDLENPNTDATQVVTPGSNLSYASQTMHALSYGKVDLNSTGLRRPAIIFKKLDPTFNSFGWDYDHISDHNDTHIVHKDPANENILIFDENLSQKGVTSLIEQYRLCWSAYALVPEGAKANDYNLTLYYNYQPWYGDKYSDGSKSIVAEHVSSFKFLQSGNTVRVKLCIQDSNQTGVGFGFCKEKAVF